MNSNIHCPRCGWRVSREDRFCGGCAYKLVILKVSPDPDEDLGGRAWTIFDGIPIALKLKNAGINPIEISELSASGFEITQWHGTIEPPYTLNADESVELRCSHDAPEGGGGRLELLSSSDPVDLFVRCQKAPEISLVSQDDHVLRHDTDEPQLCDMNPDEGRIGFTLCHDSPLMLQAAPYLSEGESHFVLRGLPEAFPHQLSPDHRFRFGFIRRQDFSEETCRAVLNFPFDGLGEIVFDFSVRYVERPKINRQFSRRFVNEDALVSGGKEKIDFALTITHEGGPPLRIARVESNREWLEVKSQITDQDSILIDSSSAEIDLLLNRGILPAVEQATALDATLNIEGIPVGEDAIFRESISLPVQIRPPQALEYPIAVDFGTTNSCIAYQDPQDGNREKLLRWGAGEGELPSVFQFLAIAEPDDYLDVLQALGPDERRTELKEQEVFLRFGDTLTDLRFRAENIPSISWGFKHNLRTPDEKVTRNDLGTGSISINGRRYTRGNRYVEVDAIEMVGLYLRFLLERFQEMTGYFPLEAVFTYPAVFNHHKAALKKAIEWATEGMELEEFILDISEPEAIALDYALDLAATLERGQTIVYGVFDCGGGTTDISIVRLTSQTEGRPDVEILGSDGDNSLGGNLLSFRLARYLYAQIVPEPYRTQFPFPKTLNEALRSRNENFTTLYELAEKIKENSKILSDFEDALDDAPSLHPTEKGILDLIEDPDITVNWPRIVLSGADGASLEVRGTERLLDETKLGDMAPLDIGDLYDAVRGDLEKGFEKLDQMQAYLFEKERIADVELDCLILEGNSSRFPLVKRVADEKARTKKIIFNPKKLKRSVALGSIEYGASLKALPTGTLQGSSDSSIEYGASLKDSTRPRIMGIHKLNYPICRSAFTHFVPIFDRWTPLKPNTTITPETPSPIISTETARGEIGLFEFFGWDFNTRLTQGGNRVAAALRVPIEDDAFQQARFWTYCLELRCDAEGKASLWYNYRVGNEADGSDFELVWEEHRHCEGFSYT